jgi:hypothetical protein
VLPTLTLDADAARRAGPGRPVALTQAPAPPAWGEFPAHDAGNSPHVLLVDHDGEAVAIADVQAGALRPRVGFRA